MNYEENYGLILPDVRSTDRQQCVLYQQQSLHQVEGETPRRQKMSTFVDLIVQATSG